MPDLDLDQLSINTIRTLTVDAVQAANSGHPGAPLGLAPAAYLLYTRIMKHNPADPKWPDRDRFVLSAGHASMLLYSCLHLSGYDVTLDDLKQFRQLGSRTPGHPEHGVHRRASRRRPGPLGQGFGNAVGMAMAEKFLREKFGTDACDHHIFAICSDGDLMEGVASEAASIAGHLRLGKCVFLYDDNSITIDGPTSLSFDQEDVPKRFEAYGWHTLDRRGRQRPRGDRERDPRRDGRDRPADADQPQDGHRLRLAARRRPAPRTRTRCPRTRFAPPRRRSAGAPTRRSTSRTRWRRTSTIASPARRRRPRGRRSSTPGRSRIPSSPSDWKDAQAGKPKAGFGAALDAFDPGDKPISTRKSGAAVMQAFGPYLPTMVGGAADLYHSTFTEFEGDAHFTPAGTGRNVAWGVREHGMGAAVNGLALHGGIVKPFCSTFFVFTDYMRPPIRLSALMGIDPVWIFSHDSVAVGEDGPTHQPVEHLAAMRAIPKLTVIRPSDATEVVEAWRTIIEDIEGPALLVLSRQDVPVLDRSTLGAAEGLRKGAYVLADEDSPDVVLVATGAEVSTALGSPRDPRRLGRPGPRRLDAELGALRGSACRVPRRGASGRPAEDLRRGRGDVRLVALGRRVDRDRHVRRVGQGPRGARALRDQPGRRRRERPGEARRAGEGLDNAS